MNFEESLKSESFLDLVHPSRPTTAANETLDCICSGMSNGTDQVQPPPENTAIPAESTPRRKRASPGDSNWLPSGWTTEERVRTSGSKSGVVDKFYYEPVTNRKFRSKNEVMYYLEHGTPKEKTKKAKNGDTQSERSESRGSKRHTKSNKKANEQPQPPQPPKPLEFDFLNVPEKVMWTGTNGSEEAWWPFIGDYKILESVSQEWDRAFNLVTAEYVG